MFGLIKGFNCLFNPRVPHVHLNPLFQEIPELDPTKGGTLIGSSRDYIDPERTDELDVIADRLRRLGIDGLICIGGDGTFVVGSAIGRMFMKTRPIHSAGSSLTELRRRYRQFLH